jgi:RHS repeat-associated protein
VLFEVTRGPQGEILERAFASGGFERYTYDRNLRRVAAETRAGNQAFAYDSDGERIADLRDGKGVHRRVVDGQLLHYRVLDRFLTKYRTFETAHAREIIITDPTGREHTLRDHKCGVFTRELASGRVETVQYHPEGHCLGKVVQGQKDTAPEWSRRYEYSAEGYLLAAHDSARGTTRYEHDAGHRLVAEHAPGVPPRKFDHDGAGNLLFNGAGYALYHAGNVLAEANGRRFEHDLRHAVSTESWQGAYRRFHRDERDQLVQVEQFRSVPMDGTNGGVRWLGGPVWTARYDALNRRVDKTVAGQTTTFYWDSDRLAAEIQPSGALRVYIYADTLAMTPLLFVDYASVDAAPASGIVYAVYADHLGCPERIEDMTGEVVWSGVIAPYGALQVTAGAAFHQPLRWPGHYWDAELGLQYNRFRTYSPELGRYLEPDPLGRAGGLENVYAYTANPLFRVDIDGQCPQTDADAKKQKEAEEKAAAELAAKATASGEEERGMSRAEAAALARRTNAEYRAELDRKIAAGEMSQKDAGPVTATVVDRKTGQAFSAHNDRDGDPPANMHPVVDKLVTASIADPQHPSAPGSHAEVHALNDAVNARDASNKAAGLPPPTEADLGDFTQVSTWRKGSGNGNMKPGEDAPRCGSCQGCTNGVDNQSGDAPLRPPTPPQPTQE